SLKCAAPAPLFPRPPINHAIEAAVQPRLSAHRSVPAVDRLVQNVRAVSPEAIHFLRHANARSSHQILVALIPQLVPMRERARHASGGDPGPISEDCLYLNVASSPIPPWNASHPAARPISAYSIRSPSFMGSSATSAVSAAIPATSPLSANSLAQ